MKTKLSRRDAEPSGSARRFCVRALTGTLTLSTSMLLLSGCSSLASSGSGVPTFVPVPPADGKAVVYFYRQSSFIGAARGYTVFLNDKPMGNIDSGSWRRVEIAPGRYAMKAEFTTFAWMGPGIQGGEIYLEAGQTRFLRIAFGITTLGLVPAGGTLLWASNNQFIDVERKFALLHLSKIGPSE